MPSSPSGSTIDFHTSATKQSSLLPSGISSERKIQLNILQLYLYNFAILPTWSTATAQPPMSTFTSTSLRSPMNNTVPNTSTTSFLDNSSPSQLTKPGRSITSSIYTDILDNYLSRLIPINDQAFPAIVGPFFIDTLAELWIRMPWISNNNKLSPTLMYYISHFINYIVRHDLRRCVNNTQDNVYTYTYKATRDELYMLTSRLALNWDKTDDYIQAGLFFSLLSLCLIMFSLDYRTLVSMGCTLETRHTISKHREGKLLTHTDRLGTVHT